MDFVFDRGLFYIAIENIGEGPALKVTTKFDQKITGAGGTQDITSLPLFQNIEFLAPHKSITTFLDTSTAYFGRGEPRKISVTISYRGLDQKRYHVTIHHDLGIYEDIGYVTSPQPGTIWSNRSPLEPSPRPVCFCAPSHTTALPPFHLVR